MQQLIATNKQTVVVGLGLTGVSVARYLLGKKRLFSVMDSRANPPGLDELKQIHPEVNVITGRLDQDILCRADEIILSPGIPRERAEIQAALAAGVTVVGDIELFLREVNVPVVGITGSNGKTTVTTLVGMIAERAGFKTGIGGNIGTPALDLINAETELYVLELSSFQLESVSAPNLAVACVLNLSEDHMDRYDSFWRYCQAKQKIFWGAKKVIYNLDDKLTVPPIANGVARYGFSLGKPVEENEAHYYYDEQTKLLFTSGVASINAKTLKIKGLHNVANVLAVFAICDAIGIDRNITTQVVTKFNGIKHRCQWVGEKNGVTFINDSKATNVGASCAAITGLKDEYRPIHLIAGGDGKGADFSSLGKAIDAYVSVLVLLGCDAEKIAQVVSSNVAIRKVSNMKDAVDAAAESCPSGGLILLSPACASLDMYSNYEERGQQFIDAALDLCA